MKISAEKIASIVGAIVLMFSLNGCGSNSSEEPTETFASTVDDSGIISSPLVDEEALREQNNASSNSLFLPSEESFVTGGGDVGNLSVDNNTYVDLDLVESEPAIVGEEIVVRLGESAIFFTSNVEEWTFDESATSSDREVVFSTNVPENSKKSKGLVFTSQKQGNYVVALKNKETGMLLEFFVKFI